MRHNVYVALILAAGLFLWAFVNSGGPYQIVAVHHQGAEDTVYRLNRFTGSIDSITPIWSHWSQAHASTMPAIVSHITRWSPPPKPPPEPEPEIVIP